MAKKLKIGITGLPGSGKTHALKKIIEMLRKEGITVGGMLTEPIVEGGRLVGHYIISIQTGEKGVLAKEGLKSRKRIMGMGIDLETLENIGVTSISDAIDNCDVVVVDEVGKFEVESQSFVRVVRRALESDKVMILTLHKKSRNSLLQDIRRRDDVRILEVTPINKNILPYRVLPLLKEEVMKE
ncbi:MAG: nucleotide kinase [Thermoplasmata archaeon]|nr:MAG: nucleotide kinase [Thermoplasmata archaeon]RLF72470.1 MAG: nucleotide kinase [Thermoplasmata archaeon]RLF74085.1 MAG: nucleotide kinase [Thermoplasmata archaeon]HDD60393.1 NTPase [Euryarchaeota archaeon]